MTLARARPYSRAVRSVCSLFVLQSSWTLNKRTEPRHRESELNQSYDGKHAGCEARCQAAGGNRNIACQICLPRRQKTAASSRYSRAESTPPRCEVWPVWQLFGGRIVWKLSGHWRAMTACWLGRCRRRRAGLLVSWQPSVSVCALRLPERVPAIGLDVLDLYIYGCTLCMYVYVSSYASMYLCM